MKNFQKFALFAEINKQEEKLELIKQALFEYFEKNNTTLEGERRSGNLFLGFINHYQGADFDVNSSKKILKYARPIYESDDADEKEDTRYWIIKKLSAFKNKFFPPKVVPKPVRYIFGEREINVTHEGEPWYVFDQKLLAAAKWYKASKDALQHLKECAERERPAINFCEGDFAFLKEEYHFNKFSPLKEKLENFYSKRVEALVNNDFKIEELDVVEKEFVALGKEYDHLEKIPKLEFSKKEEEMLGLSLPSIYQKEILKKKIQSREGQFIIQSTNQTASLNEKSFEYSHVFKELNLFDENSENKNAGDAIYEEIKKFNVDAFSMNENLKNAQLSSLNESLSRNIENELLDQTEKMEFVYKEKKKVIDNLVNIIGEKIKNLRASYAKKISKINHKRFISSFRICDRSSQEFNHLSNEKMEDIKKIKKSLQQLTEASFFKNLFQNNKKESEIKTLNQKIKELIPLFQSEIFFTQNNEKLKRLSEDGKSISKGEMKRLTCVSSLFFKLKEVEELIGLQQNLPQYIIAINKVKAILSKYGLNLITNYKLESELINFWQERIDGYNKSGLNALEYCQLHQIEHGQFCYFSKFLSHCSASFMGDGMKMECHA